MTQKQPEPDELPGRLAFYTLPLNQKETVRVRVRILETRRAYGRTECRIVPVSGDGQTWARLDSLDLE